MSTVTDSATTTKKRGRPIFIVDDDPVIADCLRTAVRQGLNELMAVNTESSRANCTPTPNTKSDSTSHALAPDIEIFSDAVAAINATAAQVPALILLDVLLTGPNGFTLLNELATYPETADIPIVLVSSLNLDNFPLKHYNIVRVLAKETMTPANVVDVIKEYYVGA